MEVTVNQKKHVLEDACSVKQMLSVLLPATTTGFAVAVNQNIISKSDWHLHVLRQGDQVLLIKATQGG